MQLIKKEFDKGGGGSLTLVAENSEDLWHVYNLVMIGDQVRTTTIRKVTRETATGSQESERVRLTLTVDVTNIEYDAAGGEMRIRGKNRSDTPHVKLGSFHTLELELNRKFTLTKVLWDEVDIQVIQRATDPTASAEVGAVVMNEGLANVCLVTDSMTLVRQRIEQAIPRKRVAAAFGHEKALKGFFENTMNSILRHIDFAVVKVVIIASPGFIKDQFFDYMMLEAQRRDLKQLLENKGRFLLCHSSSGHKHALNEILADPNVAAKLSDTKAAKDTRALNDFYTMLNTDADRAFYGYKHVNEANNQGAIATLLVTDTLFRNVDVPTRARHVQLVEDVQAGGGTVCFFSSEHSSGAQLAELTGVAAILRFPIPDIGDDDEEDESEEDEDDEHPGFESDDGEELDMFSL